MVNLFCFGYGYVAQHLCHWYPFSWQGTKQSPIPELGTLLFNDFTQPSYESLDAYTHFLISVPPMEGKDIVLNYYKEYFERRANTIKWIGYLSATSVYGDHMGKWVDEKTPPSPTNKRGEYRLVAEKAWMSLFDTFKCPVHIFRLSSIYGPKRSVLDRIVSHTPPIIDKPGHFFSRIHIADICQALYKSIHDPQGGQIYNLSDDFPCSQSELLRYAYILLNQPVPLPISFEEANISPAMREYYLDNKRVQNMKMKHELRLNLLYPSYKEGLKNCLLEEKKG